jgi:hypothetical protein
MKKNIKIIFTSSLILILAHSFIFSSVLKGKLEKFGIHGLLPAPFVYVTLSQNGKSLKTEITGSDGVYSFIDVQPGNYMLKIWAKGFDYKPLTREVNVLRQEITEVPPILINFTFESPKDNEFFPRTIRIKARGYHYSLPPKANIWIILKCLNRNFLVSTKKPIIIKENGQWESYEIILDRSIMEILAVSAAKKANNYFRYHFLTEFTTLPKGSYILATRKITVY